MSGGQPPARVVVCRGCCCGTTTKHSDVDHHGQLTRLAATNAGLTVSDCLGHCETSNNIVVIPSPAARRRGAGVVWLGHMLRPELIEAVADWVQAGGPGIAGMPAILTVHQIAPPRPHRATTAAAPTPTTAA